MRSRSFVAIFVSVLTAGAAPSAGAMEIATLQDRLHGLPVRPVYEGPPLTLQSALDEALIRNPELIELRARIDVARQRPAQERFLAPPTLEAQIWQWPINSVNPADTNMFMFMVSQNLPGFGKRGLRAAVAQKDVEIATNDVAMRARQVVSQVKQAYASLFVSRKAIDVHLDTVDLLRQLADVSQAKYATGRISQQDVLKAVVELSKLHDDIIMLDQDAKIAAARLNTLLDRPTDAPVGALAEPHETLLLPAVQELQVAALGRQPELQASRLATERAEAELAAAKRDDKPDFSVLGGYMLMPRQTDAVMANVGVTWPRAPWSRGRIDARVQEASAAIQATRARQHTVENAIRLSIQEAYIRVKAAEQRAALLRTTILPQSRQTLEVSRVAYQTDRVDFLAILDNQRALLGSELDYYRALSDFEQALADLERAVGTDITPAMLTAVSGTEEK